MVSSFTGTGPRRNGRAPTTVASTCTRARSTCVRCFAKPREGRRDGLLRRSHSKPGWSVNVVRGGASSSGEADPVARMERSVIRERPIPDYADTPSGLRFLGFQPHAERHPARPAARAGHRHPDALPLLLVDVGALQHVAGLLFEQVVKGQVADADRVDIVRGSYGGLGFGRRRLRRGWGRLGPPGFPACSRQGEISSSTRDLVSVANKATTTQAASATRPNTRKAPPMLPLPTVLPKT